MDILCICLHVWFCISVYTQYLYYSVYIVYILHSLYTLYSVYICGVCLYMLCVYIFYVYTLHCAYVHVYRYTYYDPRMAACTQLKWRARGLGSRCRGKARCSFLPGKCRVFPSSEARLTAEHSWPQPKSYLCQQAGGGCSPNAVASLSYIFPAVATQTLPEDVQLSLQPSHKQRQTRQLMSHGQKRSCLLV